MDNSGLLLLHTIVFVHLYGVDNYAPQPYIALDLTEAEPPTIALGRLLVRYHNRDRASVYLTPALHGRLRDEAARRGLSVSSYLATIVTKHLETAGAGDNDLQLRYLAMAVNALLKYHPANNLLPIVQATWKDRKKRQGEDDPENVDD